jgi:hypothetical protein
VQADRESYRAEIAKQKLQSETVKNASASTGSGSGIISDFNSGKADANFGAGWSVSIDSIAGGKSTGNMKVLANGTNGRWIFTARSMVVCPSHGPASCSRRVRSHSPPPICRRRRASLSGQKGTARFIAPCRLQKAVAECPLSSPSPSGRRESSSPFRCRPSSTDGHDVTASLFFGGPQAGKFEFQIDGVQLR